MLGGTRGRKRARTIQPTNGDDLQPPPSSISPPLTICDAIRSALEDKSDPTDQLLRSRKAGDRRSGRVGLARQSSKKGAAWSVDRDRGLEPIASSPSPPTVFLAVRPRFLPEESALSSLRPGRSSWRNRLVPSCRAASPADRPIRPRLVKRPQRTSSRPQRRLCPPRPVSLVGG